MSTEEAARAEYLTRMQRYYDAGGRARAMAIDRVSKSADLVEGDVWDWDDNIPERWAAVLVERWGLK